MIHFHNVTLQDKAWIDPLLRQENSRSADHCFSNIYMWDETYHQEVAELYGCLCIRLGYDDAPFYAYPVGHGDTRAVIDTLRSEADRTGIPLRLRGLLQEHVQFLQQAYPGQFDLSEDRFVFDYLYPFSALATLSGKKLQSKRNFVNRFIRETPNWHFERLTEENLPLCRRFQDTWLERHGNSEDYTAENKALERCLSHYSELEMEGGLLFSGEDVIAYTMGERLNTDTFDIHFEKADPNIPGAYAMINREFARAVQARYPDLYYMNREDDMGLENLRKAKLSYVPEILLEKFTVVWR